MKAIIWAIVFTFAVGQQCCSVEANSPQELQQAYVAYCRQISSISFTSVFRDRDAEKSDEFNNSLTQDWQIDLANKRLWRRTEPGGRHAANPLTTTYSEYMLTRQSEYGLSCFQKSGAVKHLSAYREIPDDYWTQRASLQYLSFPLGYLQIDGTYRSLADMIVAPTVVQGTSGALVSETDEYSLTMHLDLSKGAMPDRIEFKRKDLHDGEPQTTHCLYEVEESVNQGNIWLPTKYRCRLARSAGTATLGGNLRIVDGKYLVVAANGSDVGTNKIEEPAQTLVAEVQISALSLEPLTDDDFQFKTFVPDGMPVTLFDEDGVGIRDAGYVWRGGKAVPGK